MPTFTVWILSKKKKINSLKAIEGAFEFENFISLRSEIEEYFLIEGTLPDGFPVDPYFTPEGCSALGPLMYIKDFDPLSEGHALGLVDYVIQEEGIHVVDIDMTDLSKLESLICKWPKSGQSEFVHSNLNIAVEHCLEHELNLIVATMQGWSWATYSNRRKFENFKKLKDIGYVFYKSVSDKL